MGLFTLLAILVVGGVLLWFFQAYVTTIDPKIKSLVQAVVILFLVLLTLWWLLGFFGVADVGGPYVPMRHR